MRSSGRRAAHESVAVGPGLSVFPVWRARGSAGTRRAGARAREGGRREAMGAVCGKGRCRTVEHSLCHTWGSRDDLLRFRVSHSQRCGKSTYLLKRERRRSARGRAHENRFRLVSACSHRLSVQQTPTAMHTVASSIQPNTQAPFHRHQTPPLSRRAAHRPSPPRRPPRPAQRIEAGRGCVGTWVR